MCTVSKIWDLLGGCGSGRKITVDNSKHLQITCMGFGLIICRRKCSHKEHPPPLKIWFIYLISNTQTVPLKKKVKSCCCRMKSTRRGFKDPIVWCISIGKLRRAMEHMQEATESTTQGTCLPGYLSSGDYISQHRKVNCSWCNDFLAWFWGRGKNRTKQSPRS